MFVGSILSFSGSVLGALTLLSGMVSASVSEKDIKASWTNAKAHIGILYSENPSVEVIEWATHGSKESIDGLKVGEQGPAPVLGEVVKIGEKVYVPVAGATYSVESLRRAMPVKKSTSLSKADNCVISFIKNTLAVPTTMEQLESVITGAAKAIAKSCT